MWRHLVGHSHMIISIDTTAVLKMLHPNSETVALSVHVIAAYEIIVS